MPELDPPAEDRDDRPSGESDVTIDPRHDLAEAEAQRMRLYARLPSSPWWFYPALGGVLWILLVGVAVESNLLSILIMVGGAALLGALTGANARHTGFMPRIRSMPTPLRRAAITAWVVYGVVWLSVYGLVWLVLDGVVVAAAVGAVLWVVLAIAGPAYDRLYARIADQLAADADQIASGAGRP